MTATLTANLVSMKNRPARPYPGSAYVVYSLTLPDGTLAHYNASCEVEAYLHLDRVNTMLSAGSCLCYRTGVYRDKNGRHACFCDQGKRLDESECPECGALIDGEVAACPRHHAAAVAEADALHWGRYA